ncbi:MAG TPA: CpsD/CapB family tyrosine-protein kinase [Candidatus Aquilonibacter sp.]|nr:CpsD/CapB family tyrosine-protein kinase [Candidatus Aquilonibacter sp.]
MSRIHEALKKAEQERAETQEGLAQPSLVPPASDLHGAEVEPIPASTAANGTAAPVAFSSSFNPEALLARCLQQPWNPDTNTMLFFNGDENARGAEQFRTLRSRLYHLREKMALKKILVTSALPKEGKSFTAANLAQVMVRQHGRRVLIIDGDLRSPQLHMMMGTTCTPGLADYLRGETDEFSIMQRGPLENLFFIPSGNNIVNPAELASSGRLKLLLQRVEPLFDWIVVDSSPAIPVSDASLLATACDGVLMVVRCNSTPFDMARRARQEFRDQTLVGVVLNGADAEVSAYARYYYEAYEKK